MAHIKSINIFACLRQRQAVFLGAQLDIFPSPCQLLQPKDRHDIFRKDLFLFNAQQSNKNKT